MFEEQMSKTPQSGLAPSSANLPNAMPPMLTESMGKKYSELEGIGSQFVDEVHAAMPPYKDEHVLVSEV